jgi:hypothetical protein
LAAVGRGDAIEYFRLDAKGRQTNTESKLVARSRFATDRNAERREAVKRAPKPQRTIVQQTAPAWTEGWSWRDDSANRGNWNYQSSSRPQQQWGFGDYHQRSRRDERSYW